MILIDDLKGTTIKKLTGAKRVRKSFHNIVKSGAGSFAFVVIFERPGVWRNEEWYEIRGFHDSKRVVYDLRVKTYSNSVPDEVQAEHIERIKDVTGVIVKYEVFRPGKLHR